MLVRYTPKKTSIVADYYHEEDNTTLAIVARGAPGLPSQDSSLAHMFLQHHIDYLSPFYYGMSPSKGSFTPQGCIDSIVDTYHHFTDSHGGCTDIFSHTHIHHRYTRILLIGKSFGGWVVSMVPAYIQTTTHLQAISLRYPALSFSHLAQQEASKEQIEEIEKTEETEEESVEEFRDIIADLSGIYKDIDRDARAEHMMDQGDLCPLFHHAHLAHIPLYATHGTADTVVYAHRTKQFVEQLRISYTNTHHVYKELYGLGHGGICKKAAAQGFLYRLHKHIEDTNS